MQQKTKNNQDKLFSTKFNDISDIFYKKTNKRFKNSQLLFYLDKSMEKILLEIFKNINFEDLNVKNIKSKKQKLNIKNIIKNNDFRESLYYYLESHFINEAKNNGKQQD